MLPEHRRGQAIRYRRIRKPDWIGDAANFSEGRMFNLDDQAARKGLRVTQSLWNCIDGGRGNAGIRKLFQPSGSRLQVEAFLQNRHQFRTMLDAQRIADEPRIRADSTLR